MRLFLRFDDYIVRPVEESDRSYIEATLADDEYHKETTPDFFLQLVPGEASWAVEDQKGNVVLYFKTQNVARLHMIFPSKDREVNRNILTRGMEWLAGMLVQNRFHEMLFDATGRELRVMAKRRLGFRDSPGELVKSLPAYPTSGGVIDVLHHRQQESQSEG